jgi:DNA-binding HxlR family transcriptional regulator
MVEETFVQGVHGVRELLCTKWSPDVLAALTDGPLHYSEILDLVHPEEDVAVVHPKTLTKALQELGRAGLVVRTEEAGVFPPSVTYKLTAAAEELIHAITPAARWVARRRRQ